MSGEAVLFDPYHPYAVRMIEALARDHGLRTVVAYTDRHALERQQHKFPALTGPHISASYLVRPGQLEAFAGLLARQHDVRAVCPHQEPAVLPAARLAAMLHLGWPQPGVVEMFRDKHALKTHLAQVPGGPRINAVALVRTPDDIRAAVGSGRFPRYVLKPNDGFGNASVGYFDADEPGRAEALLATRPDGEWLMEELIDGPELFVDGQVDADGGVEVFSVSQYVRAEAGGTRGLALGDVSVRTTEPLFGPSAAYATEVVRASGLRRSPFHLELKVDASGPCLIEVAARLVGGNHAVYDGMLHGGALDPFRTAVLHYVEESSAPAGLDWAAYDRRLLGQINGLSTASGLVRRVEGVAAVEGLPEFELWDHEPRVGERLQVTSDLLSHAWRLAVSVDDLEHYRTVSERVRGLLVLNRPSGPVRDAVSRAAAYRPLAVGRARRALRPVRRVAPVEPRA